MPGLLLDYALQPETISLPVTMATTPENNRETEMVAAPPEKETKLVMVKQGSIDCIQERGVPTLNSDRECHYRRIQAETVALLKKMRDEDDAVILQFDAAMGYAMKETENRDDEREDEDDGSGSIDDEEEEVATPGAVARHGVCKL